MCGPPLSRRQPPAFHNRAGQTRPLQRYNKQKGPKGALPLAEEISATELSLPMFYGMTDAQVQAVIDAVNDFKG